MQFLQPSLVVYSFKAHPQRSDFRDHRLGVIPFDLGGEPSISGQST